MSGRRLRWLLVPAAAGLVTVLLVAAGGSSEQPHSPRPAPPLSGLDLDGRHHDLEDLRGFVVLVTAWASWCEPCREEVPVFSAALADHRDEGLRVLGLNVQDRPENAQAFVEAERPPFASVVDREGTLAVEWGLRGLPETFVVDRDGRVVAHRFGAVTQQWVEDVVAPVVRS